jgi:hypothetical protein
MHHVCVAKFRLGDVEDPEIYAAGPILDWQKSESGSWVMQHSLSPPVFQISPDIELYGYCIKLWADLSDEDYTFYNLKYTTY